MITDEVSIYNLALNAIGARNNVVSPTEKSREAEVCKLWYTVVRDQILAASPWPCAKAFRRLALLNQREGEWETISPDPQFAYVFSAPEDMLRPRTLDNFSRFSLSTYPGNIIGISCDYLTPILTYTSRNVNIAMWDAGLQMAVVYGLASYICMPLTGKSARARAMLEQSNALTLVARADSANEDMGTLEAMPDWLIARGFGGPALQSQYIYPHGQLLTLTGGLNVN